MLRVLLADDKASLRSAMRLLLEQDPDWEIVGEAAEVRGLLAKTDSAHPHLILLDWELPGLPKSPVGQHDLLGRLHTLHPCTHVIVLSGRPEAEAVALAAGADVFVSKAAPPEALLAALHQIKTDHDRDESA